MRKKELLILMTTFIICGVFLLSALGNAAGVTYYADSVGGNDANNGTSTATPWKTFVNVTGRTFNAGDSILLKCGSTWTTTLEPKGNGTSAAPITISSYGTGARPIINCGSTASSVVIWNNSGWAISNLECIGVGVSKQAGPAGIYIDSNTSKMSYFRISNVLCHGQWFGIAIGAYRGRGGGEMRNQAGYNNGYVDDVIIDNCECYGNNDKGIVSTGNYSGGGTPKYPRNTNITVRNCYVHDLGGDGVLIACTAGSLVENCKGHNCGSGQDDRYAFWPWSASNVTFQLCEACHTTTSATKGAGGFDIDYDTANCTVQYCYSHDNGGPFLLIIGYGAQSAKNAVARYNISQNDCLNQYENGVILPFGTVIDSDIYNNVCYFPGNSTDTTYGSFPSSWGGFGNVSNTKVRNNIFYCTGTARMVWVHAKGQGATNVYDYNCFYSTTGTYRYNWGSTTYTSLAAYQAATGRELHSFQGNPMFVAPGTGGEGLASVTGYKLQAGSPCINHGVNLGRGDIRDYWGGTAPLGGIFDIGANEAQ